MSSPALRITPGMPLHGGDCVIPYITLKFLTGLVSNYGWVLSSTVVFLRGRHLFPTERALDIYARGILFLNTTQTSNGPSLS